MYIDFTFPEFDFSNIDLPIRALSRAPDQADVDIPDEDEQYPIMFNWATGGLNSASNYLTVHSSNPSTVRSISVVNVRGELIEELRTSPGTGDNSLVIRLDYDDLLQNDTTNFSKYDTVTGYRDSATMALQSNEEWYFRVEYDDGDVEISDGFQIILNVGGDFNDVDSSTRRLILNDEIHADYDATNEANRARDVWVVENKDVGGDYVFVAQGNDRPGLGGHYVMPAKDTVIHGAPGVPVMLSFNTATLNSALIAFDTTVEDPIEHAEYLQYIDPDTREVLGRIHVTYLSGVALGSGLKGDTERLSLLEGTEQDNYFTTYGNSYNAFGNGGNDRFSSDSDAAVIWADGGEGIDTYLGAYMKGGIHYDFASQNEQGYSLAISQWSADNAATTTINTIYLKNIEVIKGTQYNDALFGSPSDDVLYGNYNLTTTNYETQDVIWGRAGDDVIYGGQGDDDLRGGSGDDSIYGGDGNDLLFGDQGDDIMFGNGGDDVLVHGPGFDQMTGGEGSDVFQFSMIPAQNSGDADYVLDMQIGTDLISFTEATATGIEHLYDTPQDHYLNDKNLYLFDVPLDGQFGDITDTTTVGHYLQTLGIQYAHAGGTFYFMLTNGQEAAIWGAADSTPQFDGIRNDELSLVAVLEGIEDIAILQDQDFLFS